MKNLKILFFLFTIAFLFSFTYLDSLNPFDKNKKLIGKVKSVKTITYYKTKIDIDENRLDILNIKIENYDKNGNLLISKSLKPDSSYSDYYGKIIHHYNENNKLSESNYFAKNSSKNFQMVYNYEPGGLLIERLKYNFKGSLENKTLYYYNDSTWLYLEMCLDSENNLNYLEKYSYDKKGNVTEFYFFNAKPGHGKISSENKIIKYDKRGNRIKYLSFDLNDNPIRKVEYFYDQKNQLVKIASGTSNDRRKDIRRYKYDQKGLIISWKSMKSEFNPKKNFTYKYENFDKVGNWLKKTIMEDSKFYSMIEREIEYYD